MQVKELIHLLQKCDPEAVVVYDAENAFENDPALDFSGAIGEESPLFGIDNVLIGSGTIKGFVYLIEDLIE